MELAQTLSGWWLGKELRRLRLESGLTGAQIKQLTSVSFSTLTRWESGHRQPRLSVLGPVLAAYKVAEPLRSLLMDLAGRSGEHGWWQAYEGVLPEPYATFIGFEAEAAKLRSFEALLVPGLLQTEGYTDAVIRAIPAVTEDHARRQMGIRAQRQARLNGDNPLQLHAIIDEAAIRRRVGGPDVMKEQLRALTALPDNVTLQVVPFDAGAHSAMTGSFVIMDFRDPRAPGAVFVESAAGQLFVDGDVDLTRHVAMWGILATMALTPEDSARFIAAAARKVAK